MCLFVGFVCSLLIHSSIINQITYKFPVIVYCSQVMSHSSSVHNVNSSTMTSSVQTNDECLRTPSKQSSQPYNDGPSLHSSNRQTVDGPSMTMPNESNNETQRKNQFRRKLFTKKSSKQMSVMNDTSKHRLQHRQAVWATEWINRKQCPSPYQCPLMCILKWETNEEKDDHLRRYHPMTCPLTLETEKNNAEHVCDFH